MTSHMRKQISMGPYSQINTTQNFGLVFRDWQTPPTGSLTGTRTSFVRIFVDWDQLAPVGPNNPATDPTPYAGQDLLDFGPSSPLQYIQELDLQIRIARIVNLNVVLTFFHFPTWVTGVGRSVNEYYNYPPADLSPTSWWATYLAFCLSRWSALNPNNGGAYADFFEVCNEPNIFWNPAGGPPSHIHAGRMMVSAQVVQVALHLTTPILVGPGLLDSPGVTSRHIDCRDYVSDLMGYLNSSGFAPNDTFFAWSAHNYTDIKNGTTTLAQDMRSRLRSGAWRGWPFADPSIPYVLQTEGGAHANDPLVGGLAGQATKTQKAYSNARNDDPALGQGLAMVTNYLDISTNYDTGLRNNDATLSQRPVYSTWAGLVEP